MKIQPRSAIARIGGFSLHAGVSMVVLCGALLSESGPNPPDLPELVQSASLIVDATVVSILPTTSTPAMRGGVKDIVLRTNAVIKGTATAGSQILVFQPGTPSFAAKDEQKMQPGERYVFFLRPIPPRFLSEFPNRPGLTRYDSVWQLTAVRLDGNKTVISPKLPFHDALNGHSRDDFLSEVETLQAKH